MTMAMDNSSCLDPKMDGKVFMDEKYGLNDRWLIFPRVDTSDGIQNDNKVITIRFCIG